MDVVVGFITIIAVMLVVSLVNSWIIMLIVGALFNMGVIGSTLSFQASVLIGLLLSMIGGLLRGGR